MTGRRGVWSNFAGPRLPTAPSTAKPDDIGDPAEGAPIPRCLTCGSPRQVLTVQLVADDPRYRRLRLRYRLCVHCVEYANGPLPPPDADPLTFSEDAA